jgi:hypothetical protein
MMGRRSLRFRISLKSGGGVLIDAALLGREVKAYERKWDLSDGSIVW